VEEEDGEDNKVLGAQGAVADDGSSRTAVETAVEATPVDTSEGEAPAAVTETATAKTSVALAPPEDYGSDEELLEDASGDAIAIMEKLLKRRWVVDESCQWTIFEDLEGELEFHRRRSRALCHFVRAVRSLRADVRQLQKDNRRLNDAGAELQEAYIRGLDEVREAAGEIAYWKELALSSAQSAASATATAPREQARPSPQQKFPMMVRPPSPQQPSAASSPRPPAPASAATPLATAPSTPAPDPSTTVSVEVLPASPFPKEASSPKPAPSPPPPPACRTAANEANGQAPPATVRAASEGSRTPQDDYEEEREALRAAVAAMRRQGTASVTATSSVAPAAASPPSRGFREDTRFAAPTSCFPRSPASEALASPHHYISAPTAAAGHGLASVDGNATTPGGTAAATATATTPRLTTPRSWSPSAQLLHAGPRPESLGQPFPACSSGVMAGAAEAVGSPPWEVHNSASPSRDPGRGYVQAPMRRALFQNSSSNSFGFGSDRSPSALATAPAGGTWSPAQAPGLGFQGMGSQGTRTGSSSPPPVSGSSSVPLPPFGCGPYGYASPSQCGSASVPAPGAHCSFRGYPSSGCSSPRPAAGALSVPTPARALGGIPGSMQRRGLGIGNPTRRVDSGAGAQRGDTQMQLSSRSPEAPRSARGPGRTSYLSTGSRSEASLGTLGGVGATGGASVGLTTGAGGRRSSVNLGAPSRRTSSAIVGQTWHH